MEHKGELEIEGEPCKEHYYDVMLSTGQWGIQTFNSSMMTKQQLSLEKAKNTD